MLNLIVEGSEIRTTLMFVPPSLPLFLSYCSNQFMLHFFFLVMIFIDSCRIRVEHKCAVCFISRIYLLLFLEVLLKWITWVLTSLFQVLCAICSSFFFRLFIFIATSSRDRWLYVSINRYNVVLCSSIWSSLVLTCGNITGHLHAGHLHSGHLHQDPMLWIWIHLLMRSGIYLGKMNLIFLMLKMKLEWLWMWRWLCY